MSVRLRETAFAFEQAHHLRDEERVAIGLGVDRLNHLARGLDAGHTADVLRHVALAQPSEADLGRVRLPHQLRERRAQRIAERRIDVAVPADHEHVAVSDLACDEPQQQQRRLVGGVQVVEHEHQRTDLCAGPKK